MKFAINNNNERVYINNTKANEKYFCPLCGEELVIKKGDIKAHHFAHKSGSSDCDHWHYDMSEWHENWQLAFPEETREVVFTHNNKKHRADIFLKDKKTVIEFQHSSISADEFEERNSFYNSLGYKVVWLFDVRDAYDDAELYETEKTNYYRWKRYRKNFTNYSLSNKKVDIYFHFYYSDDCLENAHFGIENSGWIGKISWISPKGIEYFEIEKEISTKEFLSKFIIVKQYFQELYNKMIYYVDCKGTRLLYDISGNIYDYTDTLSDDIKQDKELNYICRKAFDNLELPMDTVVWDVQILEGIIRSFKYNKDNKVEVYINSDEIKIKDTIPNLWDKYNCKVAGYKNIKTEEEIKINVDLNMCLNKYHRVYGHHKINPLGNAYYKESLEIKNALDPDWVCVWFKK